MPVESVAASAQDAHSSRPDVSRILLDLFPPKERWLFASVLGTSIVAAAFETVGVASILPFMALVIDPSAMQRYPFLRTLSHVLGAGTPSQEIFALGVVTAAIVALGNAAAAVGLVVQEKFIGRSSARFASTLFSGYLRQPTEFHLRRDAASLLKVMLTDVRIVVFNVLVPALLAVSRGLMALSVVILLIFQNPRIASGVIVVLGGAYVAVFQGVRTRLRRLGTEFNRSNVEVQRVAQEALGGVKELKVLGREAHVEQRFSLVSHSAAFTESTARTTALLPRFVLETLAFGGILVVTLALIATAGSSAQTVVPVLALYAFAGYRLMPALQQVFSSIVTIRFALPALVQLHEDFVVVAPGAAAAGTTVPAPRDPSSRAFDHAIHVRGVSFTYGGASRPSLEGIDLTIRPRESIGLVGRTGAGKTTLAELILGLHSPSSGTISVDQVELTPDNVAEWQGRVGYVPQNVFLSNSSILENIAFGLPTSLIDRRAAMEAARLAQADDFISHLPGGIDTIVGERGAKLSGGQRQRIGIARALYGNPEVLVFDEATSALDGMTEDATMQAIRSLAGHRTILLIAHRMRTVEACDRIVMLDRGRIIADASYEVLLSSSSAFRSLVQGRAAEESASVLDPVS